MAYNLVCMDFYGTASGDAKLPPWPWHSFLAQCYNNLFNILVKRSFFSKIRCLQFMHELQKKIHSYCETFFAPPPPKKNMAVKGHNYRKVWIQQIQLILLQRILKISNWFKCRTDENYKKI